MSRALFMATLKDGLAGLPQAELAEIISDYEFHFAEADATGHSEEDIVARLGDPVHLARELRSGLEQQRRAEGWPVSSPAAAAKAGSSHSRAIAGLLLALLLLVTAAVTYYLTAHGSGGAPESVAASTSLPQPRARPAPNPGARIVISGGQAIDLGAITQERIEIVIDGGGHVSAKGRVKDLTVRVDGSGSADFGALQADTAHVDVSGTGNADISARQLADVTITGSGMVRLMVKPETLKQSVVGPGQVILPN